MSEQYVRTQVLLDPATRAALLKVALLEERSFSDVVREMLQAQLRQKEAKEMEAAALALLADYQSDAELTAFSALDGDDFDAER